MGSHFADSNGGSTRVAIVSDIHGNLPAFRAVVDAARAADVDALWCLGDLVGYGAHPDECVELAAEACDICLAGNHDLAVVERIDIADFSSTAAAAARWTRDHSSPSTLEFLRGLEPARSGEAIGLAHASPRDPIWEYVLSRAQARECFEQTTERVIAIGHSHVALRFSLIDDQMVGGQVPGGTEHDLSEGRWIVNPGSVGQPRDGDPRAAWMILDTDSWTASWQRTDYPIDEAADAIDAANLPHALARRLFMGQ